MASFVRDIFPICLQFTRNPSFFLVFVTACFIWIYILYVLNPAGPAARIGGDDGEGEGQGREEGGEQVVDVNYRGLGTGTLLRQCCRDGLESVPGRARALPTDILYFVVVYLLGWGLVFGEGETNEEVREGERNEEVEEDESAWVILRERMAERLRVGLGQQEVPLEWWSRNWKGFLLLLALAILWSFIFDPDLSESEDDLAEENQTIAIVEVPEVVLVHYTYDVTRATVDPTATVIAARVAPEAGFAWEIPFVGTLEDPLYSREIWSDEDWASAWATGMLDVATDGELSSSRSVPADVCSLLVRRCGTYPEEWKSCGLETIALSAQTLERCIDFAAGERRRMREVMLSRSVEPATPSSIPLATSTSMKAIGGVEVSSASSRPAPTPMRAIDHIKASLASSRLAPAPIRAFDRAKASSRLARVRASIAASSLATRSITSLPASARLPTMFTMSSPSSTVSPDHARSVPPHRSLTPPETYEYCNRCKQWHVFDH